jgi:hypothetical protein
MFTCIGIASAIWYLIGLFLRKRIESQNIFTVVLLDPSRESDVDSIKRTLWYADNFTTDRVFLIAGCPDTRVKEELRTYCDTLFGTKLVERCELYDILFHPVNSEEKQST